MATRQTDDEDDVVSETRIINIQNRRIRPGSTEHSLRQRPSVTNPVINKPVHQPDDDDVISETRIINVQNRRIRPGSTHRPASPSTVAEKTATATSDHQSASSGLFKWLKRIFGG